MIRRPNASIDNPIVVDSDKDSEIDSDDEVTYGQPLLSQLPPLLNSALMSRPMANSLICKICCGSLQAKCRRLQNARIVRAILRTMYRRQFNVQKVVALPRATIATAYEVEFMGQTQATKEAVWLRRLLNELNMSQ